MDAHHTEQAPTGPLHRRGMWARIERLLIGLGMSAIAWLLERAVMRSARRKATKTA